MMEEKLDAVVLEKFKMKVGKEPEMKEWKQFLKKLKNPKKKVKIGLVGKYVELKDAYKSIAESFIHAGASNDCKVELEWIHSEKVNDESKDELLGHLNGILVAPGFGERGLQGKLIAVRYARENKIPFLGVCLGMQCAVVEFAQNVLKLKASSTEQDPKSKHPVIGLMEEQKSITKKGGTMRLGAYPCKIKKGTKAFEIYQSTEIQERHRHRYEFNNTYLQQFEENGMTASGINPKNGLVEIVELKDHPWFVGVQFHPEYKSTVANPHPLFLGFVKAALVNSKS